MRKLTFLNDHSNKSNMVVNGCRVCFLCNKTIRIHDEFIIVVERIEKTICENCLLNENFNDNPNVRNPNGEWWSLMDM